MSDPESIAEALLQLKQRLRAVEHDVGIQLSSLQTQMRTERKLAEDRHETQMVRFDSVDAVLQALAIKLSTNGSGHG